MLRRFIDWWKKKPNEDRLAAEEDFYIEEAVEHIYKTTLDRDLKIVSDLLGKKFPKHINISERYGNSRIMKFESHGHTVDEIEKAINLKSFQVEHDLSGIKIVYWSVDRKEYEEVYESIYIKYANIVRELLDVVKANFENPDYYYIFCKYEDSIYIVASTLKDERENNDGKISEEVFQKAKEIIEKCGKAIMKRYRELEHIEKLQKEAVSKSLIGRLDSEIEFMEKFLEVN